MNSFYEHHRDSIRWHYRCFDRILLNGLIQPFQQPERVVGFFNTYRRLYPVTRQLLHGIADHFQKWLKGWTENAKVPVLDAPKGRRDEFVDPYFKRAKPDAMVVVLKAREPARIMIAIGDKTADRWHLELSQRWVVQYNVYINDARWGRMFVRMCPYLQFSARVCLNQHHWLGNRMREEGIRFQQCANAFLKCAAPERLQQLADSLTAQDLVTCGQKWLARLTPFFTRKEREHAGCEHRLFFSQVEYCDNLIFKRRAALDNLGERLLDANRTIGRPDKITTIFGRRVTKSYHGKLQTEIEDMHLPNPVIRSSRPLAVPPKSSRSPRSATTFRNCAPRASSPSSLALGAINFSRTDTRSAWSSSNSSSGSTLRLPLASSIRSKATPTYTATTDLNSTGSTNVSLTISTSSLAPSGSKRPHNLARKREQNLR